MLFNYEWSHKIIQQLYVCLPIQVLGTFCLFTNTGIGDILFVYQYRCWRHFVCLPIQMLGTLYLFINTGIGDIVCLQIQVLETLCLFTIQVLETLSLFTNSGVGDILKKNDAENSINSSTIVNTDIKGNKCIYIDSSISVIL